MTTLADPAPLPPARPLSVACGEEQNHLTDFQALAHAPTLSGMDLGGHRGHPVVSPLATDEFIAFVSRPRGNEKPRGQ